MVNKKNLGLWRKKYLIVDYYTPNKVLDKTKRIAIKKLDDTKILIDADDKLPDDITFKKLWDINDSCY